MSATVAGDRARPIALAWRSTAPTCSSTPGRPTARRGRRPPPAWRRCGRCCARRCGRWARSSAWPGWALHVGAMREAPLSLVQAFVAGGLALTVPMAAFGLGRRRPRARRGAAALMVVALVLLALGPARRRAHAAAPPRGLRPGARSGSAAPRGCWPPVAPGPRRARRSASPAGCSTARRSGDQGDHRGRRRARARRRAHLAVAAGGRRAQRGRVLRLPARAAVGAAGDGDRADDRRDQRHRSIARRLRRLRRPARAHAALAPRTRWLRARGGRGLALAPAQAAVEGVSADPRAAPAR